MAPVKPKIVLDDDQRFSLMKFRRSVQDVLLPHHDDYFLLRWLRARSWNSDAAEKMLRLSMQWRKEWGIDSIATWQPPEVVKLYHPSGTSGYDDDGSPVLVIPFGGLDIVGMLNSCCKQDLVRSTLQVLEINLIDAAKTGSNKIVAVFDMDNFNIRPWAWRPAAEVVIQLIQMYEANYPEILKACYVINAPRVFALAFNVVKKFLNELTIGKIYIYKNDPKKWKKILLDNIPADSLPKYYGGNLVDPDGNPRYATKIQQGGKVPKSFYINNLQSSDPSSDNNKNVVSTVIKKGDKLALEFIIDEEGCYLRWNFKTEGHDIRFGISVTDENDKTTSVVRHARVASNQMDESGVISCQCPATYTVIFDNSYSVLRSKKIHYSVYIAPPLKEISSTSDDEVTQNGKVASSSQIVEDKENVNCCSNKSVINAVQ